LNRDCRITGLLVCVLLCLGSDSYAFGVPEALPAALGSTTPDYVVKLAYGRTYGTCTELDYATLELTRRVSQFPAMTHWGPATGEVQLGLLASYVVYYEGQLERLKKLNFHDGYEIGWLPKGRFTIPLGCSGFASFLESGAGLSYVSETFRNSGSRFNWSFLNGIGLEKSVQGGAFAVGIQWRHLCNGNCFGTGDELHNSNSGTDMLQGMAIFNHPF
jgi:hypothetical protein